MGTEPAGGIDDARFGRGQLAAGMHHPADGAQRPALRGGRAHAVDAQPGFRFVLPCGGGGAGLAPVVEAVERCRYKHCSYNGLMSARDTRPQGCTNFKLRQLVRRVSHLYDAEVGKAGLKTTQYSLLSHVLKLGPIRPGDLATAMTMDASTLTRNLKPMLAAGWLEVSAGDDGRSRLVHITDAGRDKRAEAQRYWKAAQERLNQVLGVERVRAIHALVDDSLERLEGAAHE